MLKMIDIELLKKFLENRCDYSEAERIAEYFNQHPEELDKLPVFTESASESPVKLSIEEKDALIRKITGKQQSKIFGLNRWLTAASVLVAVLGLYYFIIQKENMSAASILAMNDNYFSIPNISNKSINLTLADGSSIEMQSGSLVSVKQNFTENRNVSVEKGNVYFEVKKDALHPFSVLASGIRTTALGTAFWIKNNLQANTIEVTMTEGKVSVNSEDAHFTMKKLFLEKGESCLINKNTGNVQMIFNKAVAQTIKKQNVREKTTSYTPDNATLWTNEDLQFSQMSLDNVFEKIENRYNVKIMVDKNYINRSTLTGKIFYSDSLGVIIQSISEINNLKYHRRNDTIFLEKK